mgnify:CR=1 FL=1
MNGREQVRLTRRFILEAAHIAADDSGGFVTRWCALGTLWAAMRGQSGREVTGQAGPSVADACKNNRTGCAL